LSKDKSLAKNIYNFLPRIDIGLTRKKYRFCYENIERVGKGLVVSWLGSRFSLRARFVE
jgi:hypothetical protein